MSWRGAKAEAQERFAQLPPVEELNGASVVLLEYDCPRTFWFYHGNKTSLHWHEMCNRAMRRLLKAKGISVSREVITIGKVPHRSCLTVKPNTGDYEPSSKQRTNHCHSESVGVETK